MSSRIKGLGFWQISFLLIVASGVIAEIVNRTRGFPPQANSEFPLDMTACVIFCGLSLTAGGFVTAAVLAILELPQYHLLRRGGLLLGYIGFIGALLGTVVHYRFEWPMLWSLWSPHSIPFGAGMALILYSAIVLDDAYARKTPPRLEFLQAGWFRYLMMLLTSIAAFVAALQQTAFLNIMIVAPQRFSPMWVSSMLPVNMFLSNVCGTLAILIFTFWRLARASGTPVPPGPYDVSVSGLRVLLILMIGMRMLDVTDLHQWHNLAHNHLHDYLFGLELVLFIAPALFLLNMKKGERGLAYDCTIMVIAGFMANRLNTAITSREIVSGVSFVPAAADVVFAAAVLTLSIGAFTWIMKRDTAFVEAEVATPNQSSELLVGSSLY